MKKLKKDVLSPSNTLPKSNEQKENPNSKKQTLKKNSNLITYKIRHLDPAQKPFEIFISKNDNGDKLFNKVCDELGGIIERDYFGLRFIDKHNQRQWLDLSRSVKKQMSGAHSASLSFRVKHYPENPVEDFRQEISQYLLYLEIRRDLIQGRLLCPLNELYTIGALILQSEYGDAPDDEISNEVNGNVSFHGDKKLEEDWSYFKDFKIVFNQTKSLEDEIIKQHKTLRGLTARDAEIEVLKRVSVLSTYGVDPFPVKVISKGQPLKQIDNKSSNTDNAKSTPPNDVHNSTTSQKDVETPRSLPAGSDECVYLGLRHTGITVYVGLQPCENYNCQTGLRTLIGAENMQIYSWSDLGRLACDGKDFIVYLKPDAELEEQKKKKKPEKLKHVTFRCETKAAALALWKWTVDRQSFFTLRQASEAKKTKTTNNLFRRSHSYRFIGRSQMELKSITESCDSLPQPTFVRVSSLRRTPRSHGSDLNPCANRATFPAHIRSGHGNDSALFPSPDPPKRPTLDTVKAQPNDPCTPKGQRVSVEDGEVESIPIETALCDHPQPIHDTASDPAPETERVTPLVESDDTKDDPILRETSLNPVTVDALLTGSAENKVKKDIADDPKASTVDEPEDSTQSALPTTSVVKIALPELSTPLDTTITEEVDKIEEEKQEEEEERDQVSWRRKTPLHADAEEIVHNVNQITSTTNNVCQKPHHILPETVEDSRSSKRRVLIHAIEGAVCLGVFCLGVVVIALETGAGNVPGQQAYFWTETAARLRAQPFVASFNQYLYAPLRAFFVGEPG